MEQQVTVATEEFLRKQISDKDIRIQSLESEVQSASNKKYDAINQMQSMRDAMHEWTIEEFRNGQLTESQAEAIADIAGFELTQEVEAEVSVTYNITLQVPIGEDAEDIINNIDFEAVTYDMDNVTWLSASVDRIDI